MDVLEKKGSAQIIVDSRRTFEEAISGTLAPPEVIKKLSLLDVQYYSFDGKMHQGQLVVNRQLKSEIESVFKRIKELRFPVAKAIPIVHYDWSDDVSMEDNNTSSFNYRVVYGTQRLSLHAQGLAIDINPRQNPVIYEDGRSFPGGAVYAPSAEGAFSHDCPVLKEFSHRHWQWGGDFTSCKDYHHFEKSL
ncbi:MAG: M15 family metallopeptidase [Syntrophales bacterium LBB04]|nr:M15 family metallopeptidase [Syntrophales bacterium LBB04]